MNRFLILIAMLSFSATAMGQGLTTDQNYILTTTYTTADGAGKVQDVDYYDGLGSVNQKISIGASPDGKSILTPVYYDAMRRQSRQYLPYTVPGSGAYVAPSAAISDQKAFYNDRYGGNNGYSYTEDVYDASPLNRVNEVWNVGNVYRTNDKKSTLTYRTNASNEVLLFKVDNLGMLVLTGFYNVNALRLHIVTNEDGATTLRYTDNLDHMVMERVVDGSINHDTYYVYDVRGNLCYVLPPKLVDLKTSVGASLSDTDADMAALAYIYKYDYRNRCEVKKMPGTEAVYMIYDKGDRLILTQDGKMRASNKWLYTVYDNLYRPVRQNIIRQTNTGASSSDWRGMAADCNYYPYIYPTLPSDAWKLEVPFEPGYSGLKFESSLLSETQYGGYNYLQPTVTTGLDFMAVQDVVSTTDLFANQIGLKIYEKVAVLDGSELTSTPAYVERKFYYDYKGRVIQTVEKNHLGGISRYSTKYDFTGNVLASHESHKISTTATQADEKSTTFTYDHRGRLTSESTTVNGSAPASMTYAYDELGKLKTKMVTNKPSTKEDFTYNIQGWLTEKSNHAFDMKLRYFNPEKPGTEPSYTGNITEWEYRLPTEQLKYITRKVSVSKVFCSLHEMSGSSGSYLPGKIASELYPQFPDYFNEEGGVRKDYSLGGLYYYIPVEYVSQLTHITSNLLTYGCTVTEMHLAIGRGKKAEQYLTVSNIDYVPNSDNVSHTYAFDYDGLSRLRGTKRFIGQATSPTNAFTEQGLTYDKNGNILTMARKGTHVTSGANVTDNLSYTYTGNKLQSLNHNNASGSVAAAGEFDYTYDQNGNMTRDARGNLDYGYNFINLLGEVKSASTVRAQYRWLADGTKAGVRNGSGGTQGYEYLGSLIYTRDTKGGLVLESTSFGGGRVVKTSGGYEIHYQVTDHLGNVRATHYNNGTAVTSNDYYAFGKRHNNSALSIARGDQANRWQFNGKEKQLTGDVGFLDYGARMYDPEIARWTTTDRFAEKYYSHSPYNYAAGNPVNVIDVNGDSLWMSQVYDMHGELSGVTLHIRGKVINQSGSRVNMGRVASSISSQIQSTYGGTLDNGVAFNVDVDLGIAKSMADVNDSDHLFALVDGISTSYGDANGGAAQPFGKVAFIDAGYFKGLWDTSFGNSGGRIAAHELGHLMFGRGHHSGGLNIMLQGGIGGRWYNFSTEATDGQRQAIIRNYNNGLMNQGSNHEILKRISPSSPTGSIDIRYPNRGLLKANIKY